LGRIENSRKFARNQGVIISFPANSRPQNDEIHTSNHGVERCSERTMYAEERLKADILKEYLGKK
jgi:hypothetical protein